jgi:molecular chaperone GrpE
MTSSKRRIPINNNPFASAPADQAPVGPAPAGPIGGPAPGTKPQPSEARPQSAGPAFGGNGPYSAPGSVGTEGASSGSQVAEPHAQRSRGKGEHDADQYIAELQAAEMVLLEAQAALETVTAERDDLADALLRLRAEFENYRRRATREQVQARDRAQGEILSDLLPVLDNLERALDAAEHHEEGKVLGGVRMTRDLFVDLLRRSGVEDIETVGVAFDPRVHEAMLLQPSDQEEGVVTAVLERGYRQGEHVLRPARVAVSSGSGVPGGSETMV